MAFAAERLILYGSCLALSCLVSSYLVGASLPEGGRSLYL